MPKPSRPWIADVIFTDEVEEKLARKHRVSADEVRQAVLFDQYRDARWDNDERYGERLFVRGDTLDDVELLVVLKPANLHDGIWECKTARRTERRP